LLTEVVRDDHGGTITVDDSPLGGARFVLTIPLEEES
jgi:signal transduction histidine kinase